MGQCGPVFLFKGAAAEESGVAEPFDEQIRSGKPEQQNEDTGKNQGNAQRIRTEEGVTSRESRSKHQQKRSGEKDVVRPGSGKARIKPGSKALERDSRQTQSIAQRNQAQQKHSPAIAFSWSLRLARTGKGLAFRGEQARPGNGKRRGGAENQSRKKNQRQAMTNLRHLAGIQKKPRANSARAK